MEKEIEEEIDVEEEGDVLTCEHCGANLLEVGITEVTEGGHGEAAITIEKGYIVFGHTCIESPDIISAICNNCQEELEEPIDDIISAMEEHARELPTEFELIDAYSELWNATENGMTNDEFFKLREKARSILITRVIGPEDV